MMCLERSLEEEREKGARRGGKIREKTKDNRRWRERKGFGEKENDDLI